MNKIPDWLSNIIQNLNDSVKLGMLYRALVLREPGQASLLYYCSDCGARFNSVKIHEEISNCQLCNSLNITSSVRGPTPKPYESNIPDLIHSTINYLSKLKSLYLGRTYYVDIKDLGFCGENFYFQLTGTSSRTESKNFRDAILKQSLLTPFCGILILIGLNLA